MLFNNVTICIQHCVPFPPAISSSREHPPARGGALTARARAIGPGGGSRAAGAEAADGSGGERGGGLLPGAGRGEARPLAAGRGLAEQARTRSAPSGTSWTRLVPPPRTNWTRLSTLDGKHFTSTRSWTVPHAGVLSLDFVDIRRPQHLAAQPIADAALDKLVLRKWEEKTSILGLDVYSDAGKVVRSTSHVA
jgi:hypothetical protein